MATYSFKREAKVYIVYGGNRYNIDISDITFGQTFVEQSISTNTLQSQEMFESSIINKANPANFNFTFPAIRQDDLRVVFDRALDYQAFDLYIDTDQDVFKVENCVITNGTFVIEKLRPLSMTISGEASKLTIPGVLSGTPIARDASRTYNRLTDIAITLDGSIDLSENLTSIGIQLQNNIEWKPYVTLQGVCEVGADTLMYPTTYTVKSRELSGTVVTYLTDVNNANLQTWGINTPMFISAGQGSYGFEFNMTDCFFKNRLGTGEIYTQSYDWRLTQNPANLSDIVKYYTL